MAIYARNATNGGRSGEALRNLLFKRIMAVTPCTRPLHIADELKGMEQNGCAVSFGKTTVVRVIGVESFADANELLGWQAQVSVHASCYRCHKFSQDSGDPKYGVDLIRNDHPEMPKGWAERARTSPKCSR